MNDDAELKQMVKDLDWASRVNGLPLVIFFGFLAISSSLSLWEMEILLAELVPGKPLPALTTCLLQGRWLIVFMAFVISAITLVGIFKIKKTFYASLLVLICHSILALFAMLIWLGIYLPLLSLFNAISGASGPVASSY